MYLKSCLAKVYQKIVDAFHSQDAITAFCRIRSYLATMLKQERSLLEALAAVFAGRPFLAAWGT